jgi:hypothetical protein
LLILTVQQLKKARLIQILAIAGLILAFPISNVRNTLILGDLTKPLIEFQSYSSKLPEGQKDILKHYKNYDVVGVSSVAILPLIKNFGMEQEMKGYICYPDFKSLAKDSSTLKNKIFMLVFDKEKESVEQLKQLQQVFDKKHEKMELLYKNENVLMYKAKS